MLINIKELLEVHGYVGPQVKDSIKNLLVSEKERLLKRKNNINEELSFSDRIKKLEREALSDMKKKQKEPTKEPTKEHKKSLPKLDPKNPYNQINQTNQTNQPKKQKLNIKI